MKIMVSACLLGDNCKYSGGNNLSPKILKYVDGHDVIPICPEVLGGLPTPRIPCEIVDGVVMNQEGNSCDAEYRKGACLGLEIAKANSVDLAILQSRSPSCGCGQIYDGSFSRKLIPGNGIFADLMITNGIKVLDSDNLIALLKIKDLLISSPYVLEDIGMSDSDVYIFSDKVLKVQERSAETDYESKILNWLSGKLPSPRLLSYAIEDNKAYTLMEKIYGVMLCEKEYLSNHRLLLKLAAQGLKMFWNIDISDCPPGETSLDSRLKKARYNVENGLVDTDLGDPYELLSWLEEHRPSEDLVLCHGDYCLPNIMADGNKLTGFIDLSRAGAADRWRDIAIFIQSVQRNMKGYFSDNPTDYGDPDIAYFLQELGVTMDEEKLKYYQILEDFA